VSEAQLAEYKEAFALFDKDADGRLDNNDLGSLVRALGRCPTEATIRSFHTTSGSLSFDECLNVLVQLPPVDPTALEAELRSAFRVFDKDGSGRIPAAELRHVLTNLGEKLTDAEAEEFLKQADPEKSGLVDYDRYIRSVLTA
jgi:calmodulin